MRNINKVGHKFSVSLKIETVDKVISASEVVVSWERNAKVVSTSPVRVDKDTRMATFNGDILTQEVTFFKKKKAGAQFDDKVFRLVLRDANGPKKIVGRIDLNFSQHIDIPSSSKRMGAQLSNGSKLVMKFDSKFLSESTKTKKSSKGTSSVGSASVINDDESEFGGADIDLADLTDLEDLNIDSPPTSISAIPTLTITNSSTTNITNSYDDNYSHSNSNNTTNPTRRPPLAPAASTDDSLHNRPSNTSPTINGTQGSVVSSQGSISKLGRGRRSRDPSPVRNIYSRQESSSEKNEMETLRKENRALRRRNEDLQSRVLELEHRLDNTGGGRNNGGRNNYMAEIDDLTQENRSLKEIVDDLEMRIRREPIYSDVVRDLREAKMALAIMNIERDEHKQEIRRLKR